MSWVSFSTAYTPDTVCPRGTVIAPRHPHNLAWGDDDGKTLYLAAQSGLYRMRLNVSGIRP